MQTKSDLRQTLLARRRSIADELRISWNQAIARHIDAWLNTHRVHTLGVYWPIRGEPDLRDKYVEWSTGGMQLALPVVIDKNQALKFVAWTPGDALNKDAMGVMVPMTTQPYVNPDAILVPCVGFNSSGIRLGYGGGFYDRTLAAAPRPKSAGIAYSCLLAEFDADDHDIALDIVITE